MKLFMFYVGGDCRNSNIELHDVRFSVGTTPEDCFQDLRDQWWGEAKSLHLDCWGHVQYVDGYDVIVTSEKPQSNGKALFFVNLGGYAPQEFSELHKNLLLVAPDAKTATSRALTLVQNWSLPHKDNVYDVEILVNVSDLIHRYSYFLSLQRTDSQHPFKFSCNYVPIAKAEV